MTSVRKRPRPAILAIALLLLPVAAGCGGGERGGGDGADADAAPDDRADGRAELDAAPPVAFERFRQTRLGGLCQEDADCQGFVELVADGTLRVDRFGESPVVVHEAAVTAAELEEAIVVLTAPALVALLDAGEPPCVGPTDLFETMTLELDGTEHSVDVTTCANPPLVAARTILADLVMAHDL